MPDIEADWAETVAIRTLGYIGQDERKIRRFLLATGLRGDTIRNAATSTGFLRGVLSAALEDDMLTEGMFANTGIPRRQVTEAFDVLAKRAQREQDERAADVRLRRRAGMI
ncbi:MULTISPECIES: DUF3572 family protein [unclassified Chelatococcus]|uniref:DUF3572 family protein n=1 Tax=unclassified Chelatococcus TaxID=2638111 RepID=UPI001BD07926|nr:MULTISPECIES: DUF3572 family protein [unclassified Chelatococcus]CAH1670570.1 hypothetical protein CHELA41_23411 [Hyphomicrobiales bacterium]MBS7738354.1 DUF3572 family protein [Chelatococcus sp. HY11]MBX3545882.1 DUF3572 family protein [Chelatococcus sp.]MCO5077300.1 DUF3572 domain-containing protein [Chelatococcus sp.]CAH1677196.1 hypothetical protein CHELA20_51601 [Hyphomicrobiales bacterium]